jgi:hypothetical protein
MAAKTKFPSKKEECVTTHPVRVFSAEGEEHLRRDAEVTIRQVWVVRDDAGRMGLFVSYRSAAQSVPGTMRIDPMSGCLHNDCQPWLAGRRRFCVRQLVGTDLTVPSCTSVKERLSTERDGQVTPITNPEKELKARPGAQNTNQGRIYSGESPCTLPVSFWRPPFR